MKGMAHGRAAMHHHGHAAETRSWRDYLPLIVIVALTAAAATVRQLGGGAYAWAPWMHDFMGFFLVIFSMFKFFDLEGFADGFQMYDLLARRVRAYGYAYPFIEAGLGLGYFAGRALPVVYATTIVVTLFGAAGVLLALRRGLDVRCACMGTVLKVPLSTVALAENLSMAAMAAAMALL